MMNYPRPLSLKWVVVFGSILAIQTESLLLSTIPKTPMWSSVLAGTICSISGTSETRRVSAQFLDHLSLVMLSILRAMSCWLEAGEIIISLNCGIWSAERRSKMLIGNMEDPLRLLRSIPANSVRRMLRQFWPDAAPEMRWKCLIERVTIVHLERLETCKREFIQLILPIHMMHLHSVGVMASSMCTRWTRPLLEIEK